MWELYTEADKQKLLLDMQARRAEVKSTLIHELTHSAYTIKDKYGMGEKHIFSETGKDYFSLFDVKNIIKHNIDYTIDRSFYIKDIDKYVIDGKILTLDKKIRLSRKGDIMKLTKLASALLDAKPVKKEVKKDA